MLCHTLDPREPRHDRRERSLRSPRIHKQTQRLPRIDHPLRRPLPHAFRIAIAPHLWRQDALVPLIDQIAHRLPRQMR